MYTLSTSLAVLLAAVSATHALPSVKRQQQEILQTLPVPGYSNYYNTYRGRAPPYPGNETAPIPATTNGTAGADDLLYQNLLSAEWAIFSFYQQAVEKFNASDFIAAGLPNNTYDRVQEIRNAEAGHLAIFQSQISSNSLKPGPCEYEFGIANVPTFVLLITLLELASMLFLTGLVQQANTLATRGALTAIAATESRHETWVLMGLWNENPFGGPADTSFPYANEILETTNQFIVPGSCPAENPEYPYPSQKLPQFTYNSRTNSSLQSGTEVEFVFTSPPPVYEPGKQYFAVYFHSIWNVSVPFDHVTNTSRIPDFELDKGLIVGVISNTPGAPTLENVVAGPVLLVQQPAGALKLAG